MRSSKIVIGLLFVAICLFLKPDPHSTEACSGTSTSVCIVSQTSCLKSIVLSKATPLTVVVSPGGTTFNAPVNLFIACPNVNNCGTPCGGATPIFASLTVSLQPPVPPLIPPATGTISTNTGTMSLPTCSSGGSFNSYTVPVNIPIGTPPGVYFVLGQATVVFSDGTTLSQTGDTIVCLVEPAPGQPTVPRLNVELLTPNFPRMSPGDQSATMYRITNNDPTQTLTNLRVFANSKQNAVRPQGGNEQQGVYTISNPFGDDFPIAFDPGSCIPLPDHPYTQPEIMKPLPDLPPGQSTTVTVRIRSYGQCGSGSCSESTFRAEGNYGGTTVKACGAMSLFADTTMPIAGCGVGGVSDCNSNNIHDAVDIFNRTSQDINFNALPDECESPATMVRISPVQINKPAVIPTEILSLQLVSQSPIPVTNVWANGVPLTTTNGQVWTGQIQSSNRSGPQTVYAIAKNANGQLATSFGTYLVRRNTPSDFDGDHKADLAVYRPTTGVWHILGSTIGYKSVAFGQSTDLIVPEDYDGDGSADLAVFRPETGTWYIAPLSTPNPGQNFTAIPWGTGGDKPVQGDYTGDGKSDLGVFRPSNAVHYVYDARSNLIRTQHWGISTDQSVQGDYDGDGRTDIAVWRNGIYYILRSANNSLQTGFWGIANDKPLPGDFDGDGKFDLVVYRPSTGVWYVLLSSNGQFVGIQWGNSTDIPVPADYDGDGKTDVAIYRNGVWWILNSSNQQVRVEFFGLPNDKPIPSAYFP